MGSNWRTNSSPKGEVDRGAGRRGSAEPPLPPLTDLRSELPLGGAITLSHSSPHGEVARGKAPGRRGSTALQLSRKLRSLRLRLGCLSLRRALASIWRIRSRVTLNCWPTSSRV